MPDLLRVLLIEKTDGGGGWRGTHAWHADASKNHLLCSYDHSFSALVSLLTFAGVGKTVIAAFDYKRFKKENPRARLLFVAHRKEILEQSIQTFQEILNDFNFGELYVDGTRKVCEQ